jgi:hypothetical protein
MAFREFVNFQISTRVSDLYVALIQEGHSKYAMVMQVISHWRDDHSKILGQSCNMSKQPMMAPSTVCKSVFTNRCMHVSFHKPLYACQFSQTASDGATNQALGEGTSSPTSRSTYQRDNWTRQVRMNSLTACVISAKICWNDYSFEGAGKVYIDYYY